MSKHIEDLFEDKARAGDAGFAIAYALLRLGNAQARTAAEINKLGLGDAATPMGAIELMSKGLNEGLEAIATSIDRAASAIED